jgi:hypothetical protein
MAYHLLDQPIPDGYRIYADRIEVAGIANYRTDAESFISAGEKWVELQRDPQNAFDRNAIKVIGCKKGFFGTKRLMLGYVPRDVARVMVESGVAEIIQARLLKTYLGKGGFLEVLFQIVGPKDSLSEPERPDNKAHFTEHVPRIKWLESNGRSDEAIEVLLKLVDQVEKESRTRHTGVAPWYYEQLAIQYRRKKMFEEELAILERYEKQTKAPGALVKKLADRLAKIRAKRTP